MTYILRNVIIPCKTAELKIDFDKNYARVESQKNLGNKM